MTSWIDLYGLTGQYESSIKSISSNFDYFIPIMSHKYEKNDGDITLSMRVSTDNGFSWSDWTEIVDNQLNGILFDGDGFKLDSVQYQYRVHLDISNNPNGNPPEFDKFDMTLKGSYKIDNLGDVICKPQIWIKKINGSGSIKLINETNNTTLELSNLNNGETVFIDCENEDIVTDLPSTYRYKDHNNVFLELEAGENFLSGQGDFELDMKLEFKLLQG